MRKQRAFTLIELVMVIIVLGVTSAGIAAFVRGSMQSYVDISSRDKLLSQSRFAIEKMKRELAKAVPNSLRIAGNSTTHCIEFVPINWSTLYTALPITSSDNTLSVVAMYDIDNNPFVLPTGDNFAVVYPTRSEDVYDASNNQISLVTACTDDGDGDCATLDDSDDIVDLTVTDPFATPSPSSRVYLVSGSISYCVTGNQLIRFENDITPTQVLGVVGFPQIADHVVNSLSANPTVSPSADDPFQIFVNSLQRNSVVQVRLRFSLNNEQIAFQHEVHVPNVP